MHGGAAPQVKMAARERIAMLRDKAAAVFDKQLDDGEVPPATAMAAVRDYTKTVAELEQHESDANATSVVDEWITVMRGRS